MQGGCENELLDARRQVIRSEAAHNLTKSARSQLQDREVSKTTTGQRIPRVGVEYGALILMNNTYVPREDGA